MANFLSKALQKIIDRQPVTESVTTITDSEQFNWDQQADVVVAGFGGAGAATAIEAFDQGLDVLVLDRFEGGGATTISGGIFYAGGGTDTQQKAGVEDDAENMFNYLKQEVQGAVTDETLKAFCDSSVENHDWMVDNGVPFEASACPFKTSYPPNHYFFYYSGNESFPPYSDHAKPAARGHRARQKGVSGMAIFQPLKKAAIERGMRLQYQTKVVGLVEDENKDIIGVKAMKLSNSTFSGKLHKLLGSLHILLRYMALFFPPLFPMFAKWCESIEQNFGKAEYIKANKGVVLATGGFYSNQKMIKKYAPNFAGGSPLGTLTDDGCGIKLASDLGAKTDLMESVSAWRFFNPPFSLVKGALVGPTGQRICNEMLYGAQVGEQMMKHHEGKSWVIIDEKTYNQAGKDLTLKKGLWFHVMLGWFYLKIGIKSAPTIAQLASKIGIEPAALENTVADYNALARSEGPDPLGKPMENVVPIDGQKYYAVNTSYDYFYVPCPSLTLGGLCTDEKSGLVLREDDSLINGLFAVGRTAVGIPSKGYVSGLSIADCIFSGRRTAKYIAQES